MGAEKPSGGGYSGGGYSGGYQPTGQYGLMGQPDEEDEDVLFDVDDMPDVTLSRGKISQGVVGVDKDGDGTTDDFVLFTWEG